jgi:predicted RNA-binding protein with RPS1 domain
MSAAALQQACPVRGIVGEVRNIADFGAFVDFRGHTDGLLHTSNLGLVKLHSLLIGQQIGVDILSVEDDKVSLGVAGLGLTADKRVRGDMKKGGPNRNFSSSASHAGNKRSFATKSGCTKGGSIKRNKTTH